MRSRIAPATAENANPARLETNAPANTAMLNKISVARFGICSPPRKSAREFSSEVETGSRQENASKQKSRVPLRFHRNGNGSSQTAVTAPAAWYPPNISFHLAAQQPTRAPSGDRARLRLRHGGSIRGRR